RVGGGQGDVEDGAHFTLAVEGSPSKLCTFAQQQAPPVGVSQRRPATCWRLVLYIEGEPRRLRLRPCALPGRVDLEGPPIRISARNSAGGCGGEDRQLIGERPLV